MTEKGTIPCTHHGRNIQNIRILKGYSQDILAINLDITQQAVSELEQKETINNETLKKIAEILKVPVETLKYMTDQSVNNFINNFNTYDNSNGINNYNVNPIDNIAKIYLEKEKLYELMLKAEQEKVKILEGLLKGK